MHLRCPICGSPVEVRAEGGVDVGGLREVVALHGDHAFKLYLDRGGEVRRALPTVTTRAEDAAAPEYLVYVSGDRVEVRGGDTVTYLDDLTRALERIGVVSPAGAEPSPLVEGLAELAAIERAVLTLAGPLQRHGVWSLVLLGGDGMPIYAYPRTAPLRDLHVAGIVDVVRGVMESWSGVREIRVGADVHSLTVRLVDGVALAMLMGRSPDGLDPADVLAEHWDEVAMIADVASRYRFDCYAVGGKGHCSDRGAEKALGLLPPPHGDGLTLAVSGTHVALRGDDAAAVVRRGSDVWRAIVWLCEATRQYQYLQLALG